MKRRSSRIFAILLIVTFFESWIPSIIPPEWADIQALDWDPQSFEAGDLTFADPPTALPSESITAFSPQRIANTEVGIHMRYLLTPGDSEINTQTLKIVKNAITAREKDSGATYQPEVIEGKSVESLGERGCIQGSTYAPVEELLIDPLLTFSGESGTLVTCDVMVAGSVFVERIRTVTATDGTPSSDMVTVLVSDFIEGKTTGMAHFWNEEAESRLWQEIVTAFRHETGGLSLMPVLSTPDTDAMAQILAEATPSSDGMITLTVPPGFTAPELESMMIPETHEPRHLLVDPLAIDQLLTEEGKTMIEAVRAAEEFVSPGFTPAGARQVDCGLVPCVALTFDDGPSEFTPGILDALADADASASFFVLGKRLARSDDPDLLGDSQGSSDSQESEEPDVDHDYIAGYVDTARRAVSEGHLVLNHTWTHTDLTKIDEDGIIQKEINRTNTAVYEATGMVPNAFRPPYGEVTKKIVGLAEMPAILWDVDSHDWKDPTDEALVTGIVDAARPGSIVLQHDTQENTARTITEVIAGLEERGFTLVNLRQLFGEMPAAGQHFSARTK